MPKPAAPNAFYMFMQAQQKKFREATGRNYSMSELPGMCREAWKSMPAGERSHYEALAKKEKQKRAMGDKGWAKMDSHRQIISERKDPIKEEKKRRAQEVQQIERSWTGRDTRDIPFYIINFQVMYDDLIDNFHLPMEIGLVSITLRKGVTNFMHRFVNPGDPPTGNRRIAQDHSELTHQIPLNFQHADSNFPGLCDQLRTFLTQESDASDMPPIYCLSAHRQQAEHCLDFIYHRAGVSPFINKIYCLEDLVSTLISANGRREEVSQTQVYDVLIQNRWDYVSNIRCSYHDECDCSHCSLSIVRRYSFAMFDVLATLLDFNLTSAHTPDESKHAFTITEYGGAGPDRDNQQRSWNRDNRTKASAPSYKYKPPSQQPAGRGAGQPAWQGVEDRLNEIRLSDDENQSKAGEDEEDEDSEEEVQVPQQQYALKELRKPKSSAMVHNSSDRIGPGLTDDGGVGASSLQGFATSHPSVRPLSSQMAGVRPMGAAAGSPGFVMPPPGFRGRPLGPRPVVNPSASAWPALPQASAGAAPRPMGRGYSSARGRGFAAKQ